MAQRVTSARVLMSAYAVLVVAAGGRSAVQLATHADRAPFAYSLSAAATLVYALGLAAVRAVVRGAPAWMLLATNLVEFVGVIVVGTLSVVDRSAFPDAAVWSYFGAGYLFLPLVLPVAGALWLHSRTTVNRVPSSTALSVDEQPRSASR